MTRYTELRHAGYYQDGLTDKEREAIANQVDNAPKRTAAPKGSTTSGKKRSR
jgi:hypothetical protein